MFVHKNRRGALAALAVIGVTGLSLAGCAPAAEAGPVEISYLVNSEAHVVAVSEALIASFEKANPNITVNMETRPSGGDGDNLIKTRLATGDMSDVFVYNSGSLFQALSPKETLIPLTEAEYGGAVDAFTQTVTFDGEIYGVPMGSAMGGGVLYNIPIYEELGLEVPTTWDDFMSNNEAIKEAGKTAVIQTYKDTWTSQLLVLGDFANVLAEEPDWAERYTANEVKYATDPLAIAGFEHLQEVFEGGYLNADFGSATLDQGIQMVAEGTGAHYPMLGFAFGNVATNFPDNVDDVGFFALPGDNESNPMTTWASSGVYIPKTTEGAQLEAAKKFVAFMGSIEACDIQSNALTPTGPYMVEGCVLPDDVPRGVADMLPYFDRDGGALPALEFLSPIKGPALEQITVAVGSGITSAADGAAQYDIDVEKQAQQLGLPNW